MFNYCIVDTLNEIIDIPSMLLYMLSLRGFDQTGKTPPFWSLNTCSISIEPPNGLTNWEGKLWLQIQSEDKAGH